MNGQVVIVGDIHLKPDARNAQRLASWDQIIAEGLELPRLAAWVLCGDLFDAPSTIPDRNDAARRLQVMAMHAPVVICRGNHDAEGDLDVFARLKATFPVVVCQSPTTHRVRTPQGEGLTLAVLPYPFKAVLTARGIPPADVPTVASGALLDICRALASELAAAPLDDAGLFVGHVNVSGAVTSPGQPAIGHEISIGASHLEVFGRIPKVLGHIHRPQDIAGGVYAGSIARMSYGEVEEKRYLIAAFGPEPGDWHVSSRPIQCPPMYHVDGGLTREGFRWVVTIGHGLPLDPPATWEGSDVRVRYRFKQSEQGVLNHALVRVPFVGAAALKVEPIAVPDRALRAPEVVAARTLSAKVEAWSRHAGVTVTDAVMAKLARLEQTDPQELVREVERWVTDVETVEREAVAS